MRGPIETLHDEVTVAATLRLITYTRDLCNWALNNARNIEGHPLNSKNKYCYRPTS